MYIDCNKLTIKQISIIQEYLLYKSTTYLTTVLGSQLMINDKLQFQGMIYCGNKRYKCSNNSSSKVINFIRNIDTGEILKLSTKTLNDFMRLHRFSVDYTYFLQDIKDIANNTNELTEIHRSFILTNDCSNILGDEWKLIQLQLNNGLGVTEYQRGKVVKCLNHIENKKKYNEFIDLNPDFEGILVLLQLGVDTNMPVPLAMKINNILSYYQKYNYLTDSQINTLQRLSTRDFNEINKMFNYINSHDIKIHDVIFASTLKESYVSYGLSDKQLTALTNLYNKYINK